MMIFIKKYFISIICVIFLLGYGAYGVYQIYILEKNQVEGMDYLLEQCIERNNGDKSKCNNGINIYKEKDDTHTIFSTVFKADTVLTNSCFIIPVIFIIFSIYPIYTEFKTRNIKYSLMRKKYNKFLFEKYKTVLFSALVVPLFCIFVFFLCYCITGTMDLNRTLERFPDIMTIDANLRTNLVKYYLFYGMNLYLLFVFVGNLGLFFIKKCYNFAVLLISSMISYILIDFILEIVISRIIFGRIFDIDLKHTLNLLNYFSYGEVVSLELMFIVVLLLSIGMTIINYFNYKDKEVLFIEE